MRACIYARTCTREKRHHTISIANQIAYAREVARSHNLTVDPEHIYTDVELSGSLPPTCWAAEEEESRPALSALIEAVEGGAVSHVIARSLEKFGTTSDVLLGLLDLFSRRNVRIAALPEQLDQDDDPSAAFTLSILRPCIQCETEVEIEKNAKLKTRKLQEIARLQERIARLETEIAEL